MQAPLSDLIRGAVPALVALVAAIAAIRIVCRRSSLRRLSFALSLLALTGSVAVFHALAPADRMRRFFGLMGGEVTTRG